MGTNSDELNNVNCVVSRMRMSLGYSTLMSKLGCTDDDIGCSRSMQSAVNTRAAKVPNWLNAKLIAGFSRVGKLRRYHRSGNDGGNDRNSRITLDLVTSQGVQRVW